MSTVQWEAFVRALKTFLQALVASGLVAAYDAVTSELANGFDLRRIALVAFTAFLAGVAAYLLNVMSPAKSTKALERENS